MHLLSTLSYFYMHLLSTSSYLYTHPFSTTSYFYTHLFSSVSYLHIHRFSTFTCLYTHLFSTHTHSAYNHSLHTLILNTYLPLHPPFSASTYLNALIFTYLYVHLFWHLANLYTHHSLHPPIFTPSHVSTLSFYAPIIFAPPFFFFKLLVNTHTFKEPSTCTHFLYTCLFVTYTGIC